MDPQPTDLERAVLKTIVWFSMFSQPVTVFEIWKWLIQPSRAYDLCEVESILERSTWLMGKLQSSHGHYCVKGDRDLEALIAHRQKRFLDAERKFKRLRRAARLFRLLPHVRAVAAVNTLAWWGTTPESDIDLFVVVKPGHIWSSRFWLVLPFALMRARPGQRKGRDPFCFSFFSTCDALQMEPLCFPRDYYMAFWVRSLVSIFDRDGGLAGFQQENRWVSRLLPNARARSEHRRHTAGFFPPLPVQTRFLEPLFRSFQKRRLPGHLRELANLDSRVVVTDDMLKFHDTDRRLEFRDRFEALVAEHL
ncbi:hypothetical protein HZA87_01470 [Candidatus Uhrbacteria bacterium]|nr:hypothetical protein [Candidatus Uhrbacteria bacterium]